LDKLEIALYKLIIIIIIMAKSDVEAAYQNTAVHPAY